MKKENHRIAGTSYRQQEIISLGFDDPDYDLSKSDLIEAGYENESIYQLKFGDNNVTLEPEPKVNLTMSNMMFQINASFSIMEKNVC